MSPGEWAAFAGIVSANAGAVIAYMLRVERRLTSLEVAVHKVAP